VAQKIRLKQVGFAVSSCEPSQDRDRILMNIAKDYDKLCEDTRLSARWVTRLGNQEVERERGIKKEGACNFQAPLLGLLI